MAKLFNLSRLGSGASTDIAERSLREEILYSIPPVIRGAPSVFKQCEQLHEAREWYETKYRGYAIRRCPQPLLSIQSVKVPEDCYAY